MTIMSIIFFFIFYYTYNQVQACSSDWFGSKCQYFCHCDTSGSCDVNGQCSAKCAAGWFGPKCQYQDLARVPGATLSVTPSQTTQAWLLDGNDTTCNVDQSLQSLKISWNTAYPFTWMRIIIKDPSDILKLSINFRTSNSHILSCNGPFTVLDTITVDLRCDLNETIQELTVTGGGVKSLCSLYVSGGRNVALKQSTTQTSTFAASEASLAVDGNTDRNYRDAYTCSHTGETDTNPSWTLTLDSAKAVQRYVLYNRADYFSIRLQQFKLETLDYKNIVMWTYQDTREPLPIFTVTTFETKNVRKLRISPTFKLQGDRAAMLTLCEVELYGDCAPGLWGIGCVNLCPNECSTWCHIDTGQCPFCFGYSDPPMCKNVCLEGYYGLNCQNVCSSHCYNNSCDRFTGVCYRGCSGFSNPPDCNIECLMGQWGRNCENKCSENCYGKSCDKINGACDKGCNGFSNPPECSAECHGMWGPNCQFMCRNNCYNSSCDTLTGICNQGCNGYMDPPDCTVECKVSKWGYNCVNICNTKCLQQKCNRVTGLCDENCDRLSCPSDCHQGFYGENCTTRCSSTCKDSTCSDSGYCVGCVPGYEGDFCEKSAKDSSGLAFQEGIGIGFAACAACVIVACAVVIIVVSRRRKKQTKTKGGQENENHRGTKSQSYDGVRQINEYQHSYQSVTAPSQSNVPMATIVKASHGKTPTYENSPISVYETIEENTKHV